MGLGICQWIGSGWCAERKPPIQIPHVGDAGWVSTASDRTSAMRGWVACLMRFKPDCAASVCAAVIGRGFLDQRQPITMDSRECCLILHMRTQRSAKLRPLSRRFPVCRSRRPRMGHRKRRQPMLRIALCGYEGEHVMPAEWECVAWKAKGGYAGQSKQHDNPNAKRGSGFGLVRIASAEKTAHHSVLAQPVSRRHKLNRSRFSNCSQRRRCRFLLISLTFV